jgi:alpha-glucosidase (family GH31 glycosyl hydrolase)
MDIPKHFQIPFQPKADPDAVVEAGQARFTILTPRLIRMEWSPSGEFEDHASQAFWYRRQPAPDLNLDRTDGMLEIITDYLRLSYSENSGQFTPASLSVELINKGSVWHYGDRDWKNLRGTARTLDETNGRVRLDEGLISQSGWAVVNDSRSLVFNEMGWLEARRRPENLDLYFFGYGHAYEDCLRDYCKVAGQVPMIPRWILGNWWSRYWEYSADELQNLMAEFKQREIPLSVCIVDMDWHITKTGNRSSGWTGYTWNRNLFPDPQDFITWLHEQGLKTALNLHPAEGIHPHEEQYQQMAKFMGLEPREGEPIPFDLIDPKFAQAYFEILHHPLETMGVDFWWLDWQQGTLTKMRDLDPLWWLNHLHFYDLGRDGSRRSFIFSRWGGLGNHRYPIGFSGDTVVSWESLDFQPFFTSTAANVAYGWWSHDIGGHMSGVEDSELYTRWVQFGVFSPILRLHSTKNPYHDRTPWGYDAEVFETTRHALQLRHGLIPYLYSMAWRSHTRCLPLILPMYYTHPMIQDAYQAPHQYWFGSELIAAPFTSPIEADTRLAKQSLWLPEGNWFDFFTGEYTSGGRWTSVYGGLRDIPIYAKAGAIVPLGPVAGSSGTSNPSVLTLTLFPGANNRFELYEDDGETNDYLRGAFCRTDFTLQWEPTRLTFNIEPAAGEVTLAPTERVYHLIVRGIFPPAHVWLEINDQARPVQAQYDGQTESWILDPISIKPSDSLALTLTKNEGGLISRRDRRVEKIRCWLRRFHMETNMKHQLHDDLPNLVENPDRLAAYHLTSAQMGVLMGMLKES